MAYTIEFNTTDIKDIEIAKLQFSNENEGISINEVLGLLYVKSEKLNPLIGYAKMRGFRLLDYNDNSHIYSTDEKRFLKMREI